MTMNRRIKIIEVIQATLKDNTILILALIEIFVWLLIFFEYYKILTPHSMKNDLIQWRMKTHSVEFLLIYLLNLIYYKNSRNF